MWKKIKYYLQLADGVWSVPVALGVFWFAGILMQKYFGYGTGSYDPAFIQPLFLAIGIVIGATNASVWGLYFTFRGLYRYLYGQRKNERRVNYSKIDWLNLTVWQRYLVAFFVFLYFSSAIILVYLKLV